LLAKQEIYRRAKTDQTFVSSYSRSKKAENLWNKNQRELVRELEEKKRRLDFLIEMSAKDPVEFSRLVKENAILRSSNPKENQSESSIYHADTQIQLQDMNDSLLDHTDLRKMLSEKKGQRQSLAASSLLNNFDEELIMASSSSRKKERTISLGLTTQKQENLKT